MVRPLLLQIRRRLFLQAWAGRTAWFLVIGLAGVVLGMLVFPPAGGAALTAVCAGVLFLAALGALAWERWRLPTLEAVAVWMDSRAATRDRFATALAFETATTPLEQAAAAECEAYLLRFDPRPWTPWRWPRAARWLLVPLLALATLHFWVKPPVETVVRTPDAAVLRKADELENMARTLEQQQKEAGEENAALARMAEAFRKSAERLRAEAAGETPGKAALKELSALEEWIRATRQQNVQETLANALAEAPMAQEAAEAVRHGSPEAAAEALKTLAEQMRAAAQSKMLQFKKPLGHVTEQLGESNPVGAAAAEGARAAARRDNEGVSKALSKMSQAVRDRQQGKGEAGERLISALQEMKNQPGKAGDESSEGKGASFQMSDQGGKSGGEIAQGAPSTPGGQPGSENDPGSKASPWGAPADAPGDEGEATSLQGILGEGETLQSLVSAQGGDEKAKAGYRALYEAAVPAAQDALEQENIPLGSRIFVKRYFESIRPQH